MSRRNSLSKEDLILNDLAQVQRDIRSNGLHNEETRELLLKEISALKLSIAPLSVKLYGAFFCIGILGTVVGAIIQYLAAVRL